jgi:outer membrane protein TolC
MGTRMANRGVRSWTAFSVSAMLTLAAPLAATGAGQGAGQGAQQAPPPQTGQTVVTPQTPAAAQGGLVLQLTMDQAVAMAIESNITLKAERLSVDIAAEGVAGAEAAFKPTLNANLGTQSQTSLPSSFTQLTSGSISGATKSGGASVSQSLPWLGGTYQASWSNSLSTTTQPSPVFNPSINSNVVFTFTQPLLRGLLIDSNRASLANNQTQREVADLGLQLNTIELQDTVRLAYLQLIAANAVLDVSNQNYGLAKTELHDTQASVAVGVSAQIDVISNTLQVEQTKASVIQAQGGVAAMEDQLRTLILDPSRPDYWTVKLEAKDEIVVEPRVIDVDAAVANALANRIDVIEARRNLEITKRTTRLDADLTKTSVSAQAQYSATSVGGTQFLYNGLTGNSSGQTTKSYSSVLGETFGGAYPSWFVGVNVGYPIGRTAAEATLAQQRLTQQQAELNLHNLELSVAAQVRQAARSVQTDFQVVQAANAALDASQKQFDAETRKKEQGLSDPFVFIQKQQVLAQAKVSYLQAEIQYNVDLMAFDRLQKVS